MKFKARLALFSCSRCRKSYSNPLGHVCVSNRTAPRRQKVKPVLSGSVVCGNCRKPYANPLTHVCVTRRKVRPKPGKRKRPPQHLFENCRDPECRRLPCVAFKTGYKIGFEEGEIEGFEKGYAVGYDEGFAAGFSAGAASCGE